AENRRAGDEYVSSGARNPADVVDLDAAVDLEAYRQSGAIDDLASRFELANCRLDERLPAEARVYGHQQDEIELLEHVVEPIERGCRVQHEPRFAAVLADQRQ